MRTSLVSLVVCCGIIGLCTSCRDGFHTRVAEHMDVSNETIRVLVHEQKGYHDAKAWWAWEPSPSGAIQLDRWFEIQYPLAQPGPILLQGEVRGISGACALERIAKSCRVGVISRHVDKTVLADNAMITDKISTPDLLGNEVRPGVTNLIGFDSNGTWIYDASLGKVYSSRKEANYGSIWNDSSGELIMYDTSHDGNIIAFPSRVTIWNYRKDETRIASISEPKLEDLQTKQAQAPSI